MRSSKLAAELIRSLGVSSNTARKRISRIRPPLYKFPIPLLPKNEAFIYHKQERGSERFWKALLRDMEETNSIYSLALYGLEGRGGIVQRSSFDVISGSPKAQKGQVPVARVLSNLVESQLVNLTEIGDLGECIRLDPSTITDSYPNEKHFRSRIVAEDLLLEGFREWLRKLGLASYNAIDIRDIQKAPQFSTFFWDICGPSYLLPLVKNSATNPAEGIPGFVVADVFCDGELSVKNIQYLLRKVHVLKSQKNLARFLPFILAEGYTREAIHAGHKSGIVMATIKSVFGEEVAGLLKSLIITLKNAAEVAASNPDQISKFIDGLRNIEGKSINLRGALFEMIVGYLVREVEGNSIDIGEVVFHPETGKPAEIDVRRVKEHQQCWCCECKVRSAGTYIDTSIVNKWLSQIGRIKAYHRSERRFRNCKLGFEFWTNVEFDAEALELLKQEKAKRKKIDLEWRDGKAVRDYAKRASNRGILKTLDEHYFSR